MSETDTTVRLRPIGLDDLETLRAERDTGAAPGGEGAARKRPRAGVPPARLENGRLDLAVEADGRLVGQVEARQPVRAMPPGVFEIGVSILEAERGRGYGRAAVAELTELLVREYDAYRVQASTDVENAAMRGVLERLGFGYEGVLRGFMPTRDGGRADFAMYGVTRADWDAGRSTARPR